MTFVMVQGIWYIYGVSTILAQHRKEYATASAGDFVYIPAGVLRLPGNLSQTETCVALIARTDPNEQESVVLLPELDK